MSVGIKIHDNTAYQGPHLQHVEQPLQRGEGVAEFADENGTKMKYLTKLTILFIYSKFA